MILKAEKPKFSPEGATKASTPSNTITATSALWLGIVFSVFFTLLIWLTGDRLVAFVKPEDQGAFWYYWHLAEPTFWTRFTAWGGYALHQIALWSAIYYAQKHVGKYTSGLHKINIITLTLNAFFVLLHYVQTHVFYDGLAQDVSMSSSQNSVILLLVWVLLMENSRRGMFFGYRLPIKKRIIEFAKKYHGYVFAWAITYTFWYHPMENLPGHLIGFLYMFLMLLQSSLFFTRVHVNKWWMFVQEITVLVHGGVVAYFQGFGIWPMFVFGFAGMFIITQMHGLGLSRWAKVGLVLLFGLTLLPVYIGRPLFTLNEIIRIPVIEYLSVIVLALILWGIIKIQDIVSKRKSKQSLSA